MAGVRYEVHKLSVNNESPPEATLDYSPPAPLKPLELARLYEGHARYVYYLALRLLDDPAAAEDATHDVFLRAYYHLSQFRGESNPRTWLYRITINFCHNLLRKWEQRNRVNTLDETLWEQTAVTFENPLKILEAKELGDRIQKTLNELPEEYRLLLLLIADEQLSYEDIARLTEQTTDAIRGKLHRARKAFAAEFRKTE